VSIKTAILVDEINAIHQLHAMGIYGVRPWRAFFDALSSVLRNEYGPIECDYHFYGAVPPREVDPVRYHDRTRFFKALKRDGIYVHKGICQSDPATGVLQEKGVDVLLALDLVEFAQNCYDLLFVFSGDADLVPAVRRARKRAKVAAILLDKVPARYMRENVDSVIPLHLVINVIDQSHLIPLPA
jgi:uncharacterized LabA/DUF88 family protein